MPIISQAVRSHPFKKFYAMNFHHFPMHVDKVWILRGFENHRVLVGIQEMFVHDNGEDSLEIRDGPTSEGALLVHLRSPVAISDTHHYQSRSDTIYVRLRAQLYYNDKVIGTFVAATNSDDAGNCPDGYFRCQHGDCIVGNVVCDGFDHCGDQSDEKGCHVTPTISNPDPAPGEPFDCSQCRNGATCVPDLNMCSCPEGYSGSYCENPDERFECEECQNGATCTVSDNGRVGCICPPGYYGTYCELLEERQCEGCENGGICTDPYNGECVCPEGYYGLRCEHEEQEDLCGGCENEGECRSDGYCVCQDPYYGPHCEYSEYECGGGCFYGGDCIYGECQCQYGYYGDRCEYRYDPSEPETIFAEFSGWVIGMMVFAGILVLVLLMTITYCACSRFSRSAPSNAKKVKPYSVSAELKYSVSLPPPNHDDCHDNPTYVTVTEGADNVSLPPAYEEVGRYSNNPYLAEQTKTQKEEAPKSSGVNCLPADKNKSQI